MPPTSWAASGELSGVEEADGAGRELMLARERGEARVEGKAKDTRAERTHGEGRGACAGRGRAVGSVEW